MVSQRISSADNDTHVCNAAEDALIDPNDPQQAGRNPSLSRVDPCGRILISTK